MYEESNLIVMLGNYDTFYPEMVPFSEVKHRFVKEYYIDLKSGKWGKTRGHWVECNIGSGWGYINRIDDCPDIFGVFDRTKIEHLKSMVYMARNAGEKCFGSYDG